MVATAESCTGGLVASAITELAGSSAALDRGFVTYSNDAKTEMLGVPAELIDQYGAVSEPVARAMAQGAKIESRAMITVAVTGIAGPAGGSHDKPVGLVHFASSGPLGSIHVERRFGETAGREDIRLDSVRQALDMIIQQLAVRP